MKTIPAIEDPNVERALSAFPNPARRILLDIRELIFHVAGQTDGVGKIQETLKWGQPAYLTPESKSGSTIRLGLTKEGTPAIYTHCQTSIMSDFQALFPDFTYDGNRALHIRSGADDPLDDRLELLVKSALTYHLK